MRLLLAAIPAVLALGTLTSDPAAAETGDRWHESALGDRAERRWDKATAQPRRRIARATINDVEDYDDDQARPKRRYHDDDEVQRPRHVKRPPARVARHARSQQRRSVRRTVRSTQRYVRRPAPRYARQHRAPRRTAMERLPLRSSVQARAVGSAQHGIASYYWQGQRLASGGWFNPDGISAAHRTLPFGTRVRVTHLRNGRSVDVRINDRGPYIAGRIIDLSRGAARIIGMTGQGIAQVSVTVLGR